MKAKHYKTKLGSYNDENGNIICNLMDPNWAYFMGFLHTDGTMSKRADELGGNGFHYQVYIEIQARDKEHLISFQKLFGGSISERTRINQIAIRLKRIEKTSNKKITHSATLKIYRKAICEQLFNNGMPYGKKSFTIQPPTKQFSEADYWRGVMDGDGTMGIYNYNNRTFPQIGFCTASEKMAIAFAKFVKKITGQTIRCKKRNDRSAYELSISRENAQKLITFLYYPKCISLPRKLKIAQKIMNWKRPKNMSIRPPGRRWTKKEESIIFDYSAKELSEKLDRTISAIISRRYEIREKNK